MLFPGGQFPFWLVDPKQISMVLKSEKQKRKKKRVLSLPCNFSSLHFQFSTSPPPFFCYFRSFLLHFPFSFPNRSAKISWWEVSGGTLSPHPPPVMPLSMALLNSVQSLTVLTYCAQCLCLAALLHFAPGTDTRSLQSARGRTRFDNSDVKWRT